MELKLLIYTQEAIAVDVLIVPYGIEIVFVTILFLHFFNVLIVPYGIEIVQRNNISCLQVVLIVPCGIEIS